MGSIYHRYTNKRYTVSVMWVLNRTCYTSRECTQKLYLRSFKKLLDAVIVTNNKHILYLYNAVIH